MNDMIKIKYCTDFRHQYPIGDGDHGQIKPEMYTDIGIPYIRVQNLDFTNRLKLDDVVYISDKVNLDNKKSQLYPFDILIAKTGATIGKAGILPEDIEMANTTSSVGKITLDRTKYDVKYVYYWIASDIFQKRIWEIASMKSAQPGFNIDDIENFKIRNCNLSTQKKIAENLDKKVSAIDKAIENAEKEIEIIKEYKNSFISRIVVNGLNNNVHRKYSRNLFIGNIPENWNVGRIKDHCYLKGRIGWQGLTADEYIEEGPYLITGTDFENGRINWNNCVHITEKRYIEARQIQVKNDDLLITKDGTVGKLAYVDNIPDKASLNSGVMLIRNQSKKYETRYLMYYLSSNHFWNWYDYNQRGQTSIKHLYQEQFETFVFPIPPLSEQQEIVDYLDKKCSAIDKLIDVKTKKLETLKEYKKSLIYECVTGKKEVM